MSDPRYGRGERVVRLHPLDGRDWYETLVVDVSIEEDHGTGERRWMYQLAREDGSPSPIKVGADSLRRVT